MCISVYVLLVYLIYFYFTIFFIFYDLLFYVSSYFTILLILLSRWTRMAFTFIKFVITARLSRRSNARQFCNFPRARSGRLTATMRGCEMSGSDNREPRRYNSASNAAAQLTRLFAISAVIELPSRLW